MPMRLHRGVLGQGKPPSPAPSKERPFLPRLKDGGILARFGDSCSRGKGTSCCWFLARGIEGEAQNFTQFVNLMS